MRRRAIRLLAVGSLVAAGGCATVHWSYAKPGVTDAQRTTDEGVCLRAAVSGDTIQTDTLLRLDRQRYNDCMKGRGYDVRLAPGGR
jgi:hypothetical protein